MKFEAFKHIVSELTGVPFEEIKDASSFRDDLAIDSLQMVNFLVQLTERLGLPLDRIMISEDIVTVGGIYKALYGGAV